MAQTLSLLLGEISMLWQGGPGCLGRPLGFRRQHSPAAGGQADRASRGAFPRAAVLLLSPTTALSTVEAANHRRPSSTCCVASPD